MRPHLWNLFALMTTCLTATAQSIRDPMIGTVLAPSGEPIAGAHVACWRAGGRGTGLLDLDYKNAFRRIATTKTDRRGRFAVQLPAGLPCRVVVDHQPHAIFLRENCLPGDQLQIRLQQPAVVAGTLTTHDGKPAVAALRAWHRETHNEVFRGTTDEQGRYRFDRVAPGPIRIDIDPLAAPSPRWQDADLVAGQTLVLEPKLERGFLLQGRVLDAETRAPIVGARIGEGWTMGRAVTSDDQGRYAMHGCGSRGYPEVHCKAKGYVKMVIDRGKAVGVSAQQDFLMQRGLTTTGRLVDEHGQAIANAYVQAFGRSIESRPHLSPHDCIGSRTDDHGQFRIDGLRKDFPHVLVARKDGFAMVVYALPDAVRGVRRAGELTLPPARLVRGVLTDASGKPQPDTEVWLHGYNHDRDRLCPDGLLSGHPTAWAALDLHLGCRRIRTDHRGRFAFGDIPAGSWSVVAYGNDRKQLATGDLFVVKHDRDPPQVKVVIRK